MNTLKLMIIDRAAIVEEREYAEADIVLKRIFADYTVVKNRFGQIGKTFPSTSLHFFLLYPETY